MSRPQTHRSPCGTETPVAGVRPQAVASSASLGRLLPTGRGPPALRLSSGCAAGAPLGSGDSFPPWGWAARECGPSGQQHAGLLGTPGASHSGFHVKGDPATPVQHQHVVGTRKHGALGRGGRGPACVLAGVGGVTERALQPRGRPSRLISPEADPLCPRRPRRHPAEVQGGGVPRGGVAGSHERKAAGLESGGRSASASASASACGPDAPRGLGSQPALPWSKGLGDGTRVPGGSLEG